MFKENGQVQRLIQHSTAMLVVLLVDTFFKQILFYVGSFKILPIYQAKREKGWFLLAILLLITLAASFLFVYLYIESLHPISNNKLKTFLSFSALFHIVIYFLAIGYRSAKDQIQHEEIKKAIEAEKLKTELNYLKSQINPHFLFNTLNNLFAEARKHQNPKLSNGIAQLSKMMRYIIHDSSAEWVSLEKEIKHLKSYIDLQLFRVHPEDPFELKMEIGDYNPNILITPILFQPFVENAFKHGLMPDEQSYIHISLHIENQQLIFIVKNSVPTQNNTFEQSGIGLKNIQRRLSLIYPNRHELYVKNEKRTFEIKLVLKDLPV
jgi:LytS/YehU family sensor histidine kinase